MDTESCLHSDLYGFNRIYALGIYDKENNYLLSTNIREFKEKIEYSHPLGIALGITAKEIYLELAVSDIIVPVPLHRDKLSERGFNQSLELSKVVRNRLDLPIVDALNQTRNINMRQLYKRSERKLAVKGLFEFSELVKNDFSIIKDKNVLLIDDVVTTGFTASECSQVLKTAGAKTVNVLSAGRSYYKI